MIIVDPIVAKFKYAVRTFLNYWTGKTVFRWFEQLNAKRPIAGKTIQGAVGSYHVKFSGTAFDEGTLRYVDCRIQKGSTSIRFYLRRDADDWVTGYGDNTPLLGEREMNILFADVVRDFPVSSAGFETTFK